MPLGLNSAELQSWYRLPEQLWGKSIQPAFRFYVTHIYNPFKLFLKEGGPPPIIRSYHVASIDIPTYNFTKESVQYGAVPRTFAVLDFKDGMNIEVTYEEDELGTIAYFINWLQKQIIDRRGYYQAPLNGRIMIVVEIQDKNGIPTAYYIFHDCYFQTASNASYSYDSNDSIKYTISYACDRMSVSFPKYTPAGFINMAVGGVNVMKEFKR